MQNAKDEHSAGEPTDQILQLCGETLSEEYSAGRALTSHSCWRNNTVARGKVNSAGDILQSIGRINVGDNFQ